MQHGGQIPGLNLLIRLEDARRRLDKTDNMGVNEFVGKLLVSPISFCLNKRLQRVKLSHYSH